MAENKSVCTHDNGEIPSNLIGTCITCGADLDKLYLEKRIAYLEDRIEKIESFLNL